MRRVVATPDPIAAHLGVLGVEFYPNEPADEVGCDDAGGSGAAERVEHDAPHAGRAAVAGCRPPDRRRPRGFNDGAARSRSPLLVRAPGSANDHRLPLAPPHARGAAPRAGAPL